MEYLIEHRGAGVTREALLENVWSLSGDTLSRTVDVHIAGLRKKIEADPRYPRLLLTVKGTGVRTGRLIFTFLTYILRTEHAIWRKLEA